MRTSRRVEPRLPGRQILLKCSVSSVCPAPDLIFLLFMADERATVEAAREAFDRDFEKFNDLNPNGSSIADIEAMLREIAEVKVRHTGKKSALAESKKLIGKVAPEQRGEFGQFVQTIEKAITEKLEAAETQLNEVLSKARTEAERLDVTIPGRRPRTGHLHPITILRQKIEDIFVSMGYAIEDDREIETDYYNFDALNIPEGHPARESQDTFYTTDGFALRSQTSTVQIRAMERRGVPIRIIAPGQSVPPRHARHDAHADVPSARRAVRR